MIKRIIEINSQAKLTVKNGQLIITRPGNNQDTAPIEDLGLLILDNPFITYSLKLITKCMENNVAVITCDNKHLPNGILLPYSGNSLQTKTIANQIKVKQTVKKRLWQSIIKAKIKEQANVIKDISGDGDRIKALALKVRSDDISNIESLAARLYWQKIFGNNFKRDRYEPGINSMLNYGYAVMRASVARAVVGTGLHPSLGLHHHNQYNNFCLVDDLMEPLRPTIDFQVYKIIQKAGKDTFLTPDIKKQLLEILNRKLYINKLSFPLFVALSHYTASLRKIFFNESSNLEIPKS